MRMSMPYTFDCSPSLRVDEDIARSIQQYGKVLGRSKPLSKIDKRVYWTCYQAVDGKYYMGLSENPDLWLVSKEDIDIYNEVAV